MADKNKASEKTVVTRIKANDTTEKPPKNAPALEVLGEKKSPKASKAQAKKAKREKLEQRPTKNPFVAIGRYFKGAWQELRQVHWPTRSATWSMTGAVLGFSAVFAALILGLDAGFQVLFEQILR